MRKGKIKFVGNFWDYFIKSLGMSLLVILTLGIALPYYWYWQQKFFLENLEIEIENEKN